MSSPTLIVFKCIRRKSSTICNGSHCFLFDFLQSGRFSNADLLQLDRPNLGRGWRGTRHLPGPHLAVLKVHRHEILPPFFWHNLMSGMPMVVCVHFLKNFFHSLKSYYKFKVTPRWPGQRRVSFFEKDRSKIKVYSDWCWAYYSVVEWIGS